MPNRVDRKVIVPYSRPDRAALPDPEIKSPTQNPVPVPRVWRGIPRDQRIQHRRHVMLEAGLEVFGTVGARKATVAAVCRHAELTQRYFYESFPSLRSLLAEVFTHVTELQHQRIIQASRDARAGGETQRQSMRAGLEVYFRSLQEDPRLARLQLLEVLGGGDEVTVGCHRAAIRRAADHILRGWEQASGSAVPQLLAIGLIGAAVEIATMWFLADFADPLETVVGSAYVIFDAVIPAERAASPQRATRQPSSSPVKGRPDQWAVSARR